MSMTISVAVIVIFFLGLAILGAIRMGEAKFAANLAIIVSALAIMLVFALPDNTNEAEKGKYYATQCQLIETNINNGLFQSNTNKLKCGDVIENVTVVEYQDAVKTYQESVKNEN